MKPLTELDLRLSLKDQKVDWYAIPHGTVVTPSAQEYLKVNNIQLVDESASEAESGSKGAANLHFWGPDGGQLEHKPESLTHLKGRQLVHKHHPIIIFRGKLDTLAARILEAQIIGVQEHNRDYVDDLQVIVEFVRRLLRHEITGNEVADFNLLGLDADGLRERSHNPKKYFGHSHMLVSYKMGPLCIALNTLRAMVRETELSAAIAFKEADGKVGRDDIIRALNRLSSLLYILMFKYLPLDFMPESSSI